MDGWIGIETQHCLMVPYTIRGVLEAMPNNGVAANPADFFGAREVGVSVAMERSGNRLFEDLSPFRENPLMR